MKYNKIEALRFEIEELVSFHDLLLELLLGVMGVVLAGFILLSWRGLINKLDSQIIEFFWTLLPVIYLTLAAVPSIFCLYFLDEVGLRGDVYVKGCQWFWEYQGEGSHIIDGIRRLLEVDNALIVDGTQSVTFNVSSNDVIHSFALPRLGLKVDAVPGVENRISCDIKYSGVYYGQCSELCGVNHSFMPIVIVVFDDTFDMEIQECHVCSGTGYIVTRK